MVVDDVEDHGQSAGVARVDEARLRPSGPAVGVMRRVQVDPVVAPAAVARELGDRHQLDVRDAQRDEMVEVLDRPVERALGRERPDVQLVDHRLRERHRLESRGRSSGSAAWSTIRDGRATPSGCQARARVGERLVAVEDEAVVACPDRRPRRRPTTTRRRVSSAVGRRRSPGPRAWAAAPRRAAEDRSSRALQQRHGERRQQLGQRTGRRRRRAHRSARRATGRPGVARSTAGSGPRPGAAEPRHDDHDLGLARPSPRAKPSADAPCSGPVTGGARTTRVSPNASGSTCAQSSARCDQPELGDARSVETVQRRPQRVRRARRERRQERCAAARSRPVGGCPGRPGDRSHSSVPW